jgi:hypothetical protein
MPSSSPTLGLNNSNNIKEQAVFTTQPTSSSFWHYISLHNTKPLENRANDSCNYILNDLVNSLAEKSNNKDGKNVIDKGKAENDSNRSNIDDNNSRDSNSSNSDKSNKAYRCTGRQRLPTPITGQLKTKYTTKHYL